MAQVATKRTTISDNLSALCDPPGWSVRWGGIECGRVEPSGKDWVFCPDWSQGPFAFSADDLIGIAEFLELVSAG